MRTFITALLISFSCVNAVTLDAATTSAATRRTSPAMKCLKKKLTPKAFYAVCRRPRQLAHMASDCIIDQGRGSKHQKTCKKVAASSAIHAAM